MTNYFGKGYSLEMIGELMREENQKRKQRDEKVKNTKSTKMCGFTDVCKTEHGTFCNGKDIFLCSHMERYLEDNKKNR